MSRLMNQDKGSKRKMQRARWTRREMVTAILLFLVLGESLRQLADVLDRQERLAASGDHALKQGGTRLSDKIQGERRTVALSDIIFLAQTHRAYRYRGVEVASMSLQGIQISMNVKTPDVR